MNVHPSRAQVYADNRTRVYNVSGTATSVNGAPPLYLPPRTIERHRYRESERVIERDL